MHQMYHCEKGASTAQQMKAYDVMFDDLDKDNAFLKSSILSKCLGFEEGYDPFLMSSY